MQSVTYQGEFPAVELRPPVVADYVVLPRGVAVELDNELAQRLADEYPGIYDVKPVATTEDEG